MQEIYAASNRLDAQRFVNFLSQHGIAATVRDPSLNADLHGGGFTVHVADETAEAGRSFVPAFRELYELTSDHRSDSDDIDDDTDARPDERPWLTIGSVPWLTIAFCLVAYVLSAGLWREPDRNSSEALARWGWQDGIAVVGGAWWGIVTNTLLHPTSAHLQGNLLGIAILGAGVERHRGRGWWLGLLLAALLVCTAASLAVLGTDGIGASGVLYTLFGFALIGGIRRKVVTLWLQIPLSIWLLLGVVVDLAEVLDVHFGRRGSPPWAAEAHLAGFGTGVLAALAFDISWKPRLTRTALIAVLLTALGIVWHGPTWLPEWCLGQSDRQLKSGTAEAAIEWSTRAILRSSAPAEAYLARAWCHVDNGDLKSAWSDLDAAFQADARLPDLQATRAVFRLFRSDFDGALQDVQVDLSQPTASAYSFEVRSEIHQSQQHFDSARRDIEVALRMDRSTASYRVSQAWLDHELSRFETALSDVELALSRDPHDLNGLCLRGFCLKELDRPDEARDALHRCRSELERSLARLPRSFWINTLLAWTLSALFELEDEPRWLDQALGHSTQLVQRAPEDWRNWTVHGDIQRSLRRFDQADESLTRALQLNPRSAESYCARGAARHGLGRTDDALLDLTQALELNPRFTLAWFERARVLQSAERLAEARDDLDRVLELNPRCRRAVRLREELHEGPPP